MAKQPQSIPNNPKPEPLEKNNRNAETPEPDTAAPLALRPEHAARDAPFYERLEEIRKGAVYSDGEGGKPEEIAIALKVVFDTLKTAKVMANCLFGKEDPKTVCSVYDRIMRLSEDLVPTPDQFSPPDDSNGKDTADDSLDDDDEELGDFLG